MDRPITVRRAAEGENGAGAEHAKPPVELIEPPSEEQQLPAAPGNHRPVTAAVEAEHFDKLNAQLLLLTEANERMVKLIRMQLISHGLMISFIRGVATGFGWVIGSTIVVGLLIYFLQSFDSASLIGEFVHRIIEYLQLRR